MPGAAGQPVPGLFAAGEAPDFGGGHPRCDAPEGTFLRGGILSGRNAGRPRHVA